MGADGISMIDRIENIYGEFWKADTKYTIESALNRLSPLVGEDTAYDIVTDIMSAMREEYGE
jgi:hypothetical protein